MTAAKLGENSSTAVIRWSGKYRVIRVNYNLDSNGFVYRLRPGLNPRARSICFVFGVENEFTLAESRGSGVVVLLRRGRELECETWALRSRCTLPPAGPRPYVSPDWCGLVGLCSVWKTCFDWGALPVVPKSTSAGIRWLRRRSRRVRILRMRRHDGVYAYRAIYHHSPKVGSKVRVQGLVRSGVFESVEDGLCVVSVGGHRLRVSRSCLVEQRKTQEKRTKHPG